MGQLDALQQDLDGSLPAVPIVLLGVNTIGAEAGNNMVTTGVDIPWLQDVPAEDAWAAWGAQAREMFVIDGDNRLITIYDMTVNDLSIPANYDAMKQALLDAAAAE